jgi:hypothetical protein
MLKIVYYSYEVQFPAMSQPMWKDAPLPYQTHGKQDRKMVNNSLAVLPGLQNDVARSIGILLLSKQQSLLIFSYSAA